MITEAIGITLVLFGLICGVIITLIVVTFGKYDIDLVIRKRNKNS